ncbi:hypothetical protein CC78DRAFT_575909 [Lojkania enalia]|uniref:Uncharacterized protein n=1 Tax=Lojkania enalia TaxID=147567 RepID=A0A9P4KJE1_9PLEO|nr:hypothetical protein CC78DRAFT_575909 [Didymosphaeria enalia]
MPFLPSEAIFTKYKRVLAQRLCRRKQNRRMFGASGLTFHVSHTETTASKGGRVTDASEPLRASDVIGEAEQWTADGIVETVLPCSRLPLAAGLREAGQCESFSVRNVCMDDIILRNPEGLTLASSSCLPSDVVRFQRQPQCLGQFPLNKAADVASVAYGAP